VEVSSEVETEQAAAVRTQGRVNILTDTGKHTGSALSRVCRTK